MRKEFSKRVKRDAAERCNGHCEACGIRLRFGEYHYDHVLPDAFGGEPTLENCAVLCVRCHREKTGKRDVPTIAKSNRLRDKARGIRRPRTIRSWRRFNGEIVHASRER